MMPWSTRCFLTTTALSRKDVPQHMARMAIASLAVELLCYALGDFNAAVTLQRQGSNVVPVVPKGKGLRAIVHSDLAGDFGMSKALEEVVDEMRSAFLSQ
jgi:hypothetical protein